MATKKPTDLVTPTAAAAAVSRTERTIYNWMKAGKVDRWQQGVRVLVSLRQVRAAADPPVERVR